MLPNTRAAIVLLVVVCLALEAYCDSGHRSYRHRRYAAHHSSHRSSSHDSSDSSVKSEIEGLEDRLERELYIIKTNLARLFKSRSESESSHSSSSSSSSSESSHSECDDCVQVFDAWELKLVRAVRFRALGGTYACPR